MYQMALRLIYVFNRIDNTDELRLKKRPTILIFLPGYYEIGCMSKLIAESANILWVCATMKIFFEIFDFWLTKIWFRQEDPIVVMLHSMITHEEQANAMKTPPPDKRMIILATNIAESSITVPNVKYGKWSAVLSGYKCFM